MYEFKRCKKSESHPVLTVIMSVYITKAVQYSNGHISISGLG